MRSDYLFSGGLMPSDYYESDAQWIDEQLTRLSNKSREKICFLYAEKFNATLEDVSIPEVKRTNCARKEANTRLRLYVETYSKYLSGYVSAPDQVNMA